MINYCTYVFIPKSDFDISYQDRLMFSGSCFAEQIGMRMAGHGWETCVNPFGVLYNPFSIASACRRLFDSKPFIEDDLFEYEGMAHSFMHHSRFSDCSTAAALTKMNHALSVASSYLSTVSCLIFSFGTACIYRLKSDGRVVANCHKLPAVLFERTLLTTDQIVNEWSGLLDKLLYVNSSLKIIFTVSPVRYLKDGAHLNQISKSVLLLATRVLTEKYAGRTSYFPAYELMMDELRDYRFYAEDLLHPSNAAVDYIWERFCDVYMKVDVKEDIKEMEALNRDLLHRPFHSSSDTYKQFLLKTLKKINLLKAKSPYICTSIQEREIAERLQKLT